MGTECANSGYRDTKLICVYQQLFHFGSNIIDIPETQTPKSMMHAKLIRRFQFSFTSAGHKPAGADINA